MYILELLYTQINLSFHYILYDLFEAACHEYMHSILHLFQSKPKNSLCFLSFHREAVTWTSVTARMPSVRDYFIFKIQTLALT